MRARRHLQKLVKHQETLLSERKSLQLPHPQRMFRTHSKHWATTAQVSIPAMMEKSPCKKGRTPTNALQLLQNASEPWQLQELQQMVRTPSTNQATMAQARKPSMTTKKPCTPANSCTKKNTPSTRSTKTNEAARNAASVAAPTG